MNNAHISSWLLSIADRLRTKVNSPIDTEKLLNSFGVEVRYGATETRSGTLGQGENGKWIAIIRGKKPTHRFTAAHELGHFLLISYLNYCPTVDDKENYFFCERLCSQFAARLLIDYNSVAAIKIPSSRVCIGQVRGISARFQVSNEAAARSITDTHSGIGICTFERDPMGRLKRLWGVSSLNGAQKQYGRKRVKLRSVEEEMTAWVAMIMGEKFGHNGVDFASETGRIEISAIITKQTPVV